MLTRAGKTESEPLTIDNPYLDAVRETATAADERPSTRPTEIGFDNRDSLVDRYAWAIPNTPAIEAIADYGPILEVGAGTGYWAMLLRQAEVDVIATDPAAPVAPEWSPVEPLTGQDAVAEYPDRTLLLVWPSEDQTWPVETLSAYEGDTCLYVGEGPGGSTADKHFHHHLNDHWECERRVALPQYRGINDRLEVWHRSRYTLPRPSLRGIRSLDLDPDA